MSHSRFTPIAAALPLALALACGGTPTEPAAPGAGAVPGASVELPLPPATRDDPTEDCMHAAGCSDRRDWDLDSPAGAPGDGGSGDGASDDGASAS